MKPRTGEVYWNPHTQSHVVVYGRALRDRWRVVSLGHGTIRYGHWKRVPEHCTRVRKP
jgi:hypothetical protein